MGAARDTGSRDVSDGPLEDAANLWTRRNVRIRRRRKEGERSLTTVQLVTLVPEDRSSSTFPAETSVRLVKDIQIRCPTLENKTCSFLGNDRVRDLRRWNAHWKVLK